MNSNETQLTLANVKSSTFGKLFTYPVDGYVYAQPLVMTNVAIPGKGTHNVVYVVTEHDSVYAFDADSNAGANATPLWQVSFLNAAAGVDGGAGRGHGDAGHRAGNRDDSDAGDRSGDGHDLYGGQDEGDDGGPTTRYVHRLHALDIATGAERVSGPVMNSPVTIDAVNYPGTGTPGMNDNDGAGHVVFNTLREHSRGGADAGQRGDLSWVRVARDNQPYHGWLFAYDAHTLAQLSVYNSTPNGGLGGFWQGGGGGDSGCGGESLLRNGQRVVQRDGGRRSTRRTTVLR